MCYVIIKFINYKCNDKNIKRKKKYQNTEVAACRSVGLTSNESRIIEVNSIILMEFFYGERISNFQMRT